MRVWSLTHWTTREVLRILFTHLLIFIVLFISSCAESSLLSGLFSGGGEQELLWKCAGLPSWRSPLLQSTVFRATGFSTSAPGLQSTASIVVTQAWLLHSMWHLPRSGTELCLLRWQLDSLPLCHQGSRREFYF